MVDDPYDHLDRVAREAPQAVSEVLEQLCVVHPDEAEGLRGFAATLGLTSGPTPATDAPDFAAVDAAEARGWARFLAASAQEALPAVPIWRRWLARLATLPDALAITATRGRRPTFQWAGAAAGGRVKGDGVASPDSLGPFRVGDRVRLRFPAPSGAAALLLDGEPLPSRITGDRLEAEWIPTAAGHATLLVVAASPAELAALSAGEAPPAGISGAARAYTLVVG